MALIALALTGAQLQGGCVERESPAQHPLETSTGPPTRAAASPVSAEMNPRLLRRFSVVRAVLASDPATVTDTKVALGHMLFFETRLSRNHDVSCNTCHRLDGYGVDGLPASVGHRGQRGRRNAPTVFHAAGNMVQFWDGRAADIEAQAKGPLLNPLEMAMPSGAAVERVLRSIPGYGEAFRRAFPGEAEPVTFDNLARALGAFERRLTTPSPWDRYLAGEKDALGPMAKEGLKVFTNIGCMVCHTGEMLGGSTFQKVGVVEPWPNQKDLGRQEITKGEADRMVFKVPTLRNVERTAPYFHDGSAADLPRAVRMMGRHQLGLELEDGEVEAMVAWLQSLTGPLPSKLIAPPELPPSAHSTPAADPI
jgi:cytochrome c peroxidase